MHISVILGTFTQLCSPHNPVLEHFRQLTKLPHACSCSFPAGLPRLRLPPIGFLSLGCLSFLEILINKVTQTFVSGFFNLACYCCYPCHSIHISVTSSFLWLNNIPFYGCTTFLIFSLFTGRTLFLLHCVGTLGEMNWPEISRLFVVFLWAVSLHQYYTVFITVAL